MTSEMVFVEFLIGSLGIAHEIYPEDAVGDVVEMSRSQADLLGIRYCPTCRTVAGADA